MIRRKLDIGLSDRTVFDRMEKKIRYINEASSEAGERSTVIEYSTVSCGESGKAVVPVIKYKIFEQYDELLHGFSTRLGGVSSGHLSSMNLSFSRGDDRDNVIENHRRFAEAAGYDYTKLVFSDQVHDTAIHTVSAEDIGKGITVESDIKNIDGLITNERGIPLITFYADCVPLYLYDPVNSVVALAHSGWKGTVNNIGGIMVRKMCGLYGSRPEDIVCAIGPSICMDCYEISRDVADKFREAYSDKEFDSFIADKGNDKFQLDLHKACKYNFINAGIDEEHIAMPDLCTCCNSSLLYSHRASGGMRGNLAAVIMLYN